jgi:hypothetical protein
MERNDVTIEEKPVAMTVRAPKPLWSRAAKFAIDRKTSQNDICLIALKEYLDREGAPE